MSILPRGTGALSLTIFGCALSTLSALPVYAAWRNVCPEPQVCSMASTLINSSFETVPPAKVPPTSFNDGVSLSLGHHDYFASLPIDSGNNPVTTANALLVGRERAIVPAWNQAAWVGSALPRSDGSTLILYAGGGARVTLPDGTISSSASFFTSSDDVFQMFVAMPPVRIGNAIYAVKVPEMVTFRTTDEGLTWTSKSLGTHLRPYAWLFANPFESGLWTTARGVGSGPFGLYGTRDEGASWQRIDDSLSLYALDNASLFHVTVDPRAVAAGGGTVYGASDKGVLVSQDRGHSWAMLHAIAGGATTVAVAYDATRTLLLAGTSTGILASADGGVSWSEFSRGAYQLPHYVYFVNGLLLAGSEAGWYLCADLSCEGSASYAPPVAERGERAVVEFYHAALDHFFITADAAEAAAVDAGWAGPGWARTGFGFTVWSPMGNPMAKDVCRFYGSMSPGPNSHFYSASSAECDMLHRWQQATPATAPRWNFEALVFQAEPLDPATGLCRSGTRPVFRAYNNGFARGIDSNHRYVVDHAEIAKLMARGWVDEGIAFCAKSN